jgi:hypothetical protein
MCLREVLGHDPERHWSHHQRGRTGGALNAGVKVSLDRQPERFGDDDLGAGPTDEAARKLTGKPHNAALSSDSQA